MNRVLRKINKSLYPEKLFFPPEHIILAVNNICNLHCKMCDVGANYKDSNFYDHMVGTHPVNMPLELIKEIIDQTARFFPDAKLGFAFTEPIIYPHLIEALTYAKSKGVFTTLTTNGSKLPKLAKELCASGLSELYVSLDGPPEIHNTIRGNKNSFQWALDGIKEVLTGEGKHPKVYVQCAITQWGIGHLTELIELFRDVPLGHIGFMHYTFVTENMAKVHNEVLNGLYPVQASNVSQFDSSELDLDTLHEEITQIVNTKYPFPITFSPLITDKEKLKEYYLQPETKIGKVCNNIFSSIMIKSDGEVIPAHSRCFKVEAGNIYKNNLREIWNSSTIGQFRKTVMQHGGLLPACSRCCSAY